jgi:hypothetical protein
MIIIKKSFLYENDREFIEPSRDLTEEERETVIASWGDNKNYWYFQTGDEISNEWNLYQEYINNPPDKQEAVDISNIDIDSLTDEQISKLKARLKL